MLRRVRRQLDRTAAAGLAELLAELESHPVPEDAARTAVTGDGGPAAAGETGLLAEDLVDPLRLATEHGELALLCTTTVFGSPRDVTLDEMAIETFFAADAHTAALLRRVVTDGTSVPAG